MYVSTKNNKVPKTIIKLKQKQPSRDNVIFSVLITCSFTEYFCPIRKYIRKYNENTLLTDRSGCSYLIFRGWEGVSRN